MNKTEKFIKMSVCKDEHAYINAAAEFQSLTNDPAKFLRPQPEICVKLKELLQTVYQISASNDDQNRRAKEMLPELVVEQMDEEQIWQQLELRNNIVLDQLVAQTSKLLAMREEKFEIKLNEEDNEGGSEIEMEEEDEESDEIDDEEMDEDDTENDENELEKPQSSTLFSEREQEKSKKKLRSSIVDDKFFKLGEMEEFLEAEDAKEMRKQKQKLNETEDDGIDYFAEDLGDDESDDEEEANPQYKDFFDIDDNENEMEQQKKGAKQKAHFPDDQIVENLKETDDVTEEEESMQEDEGSDDGDGHERNVEGENIVEPASGSDSDSDSQDENTAEKSKSSHEMRQDRLQQRIRDYEDEVLGEKPWQLKGEIQATKRPQNSLLEEILEFESTVRPAPVITEETTLRLEDIIRQRIKDQAWDDVVRKVRPLQTPQEYRKLLVLDQEKSKESLAQVYEKEYQRELDKIDPNRNDNATDVEPKEHEEIKRLIRTIFIKLDALSNFHFTPKPLAPEAKIITNTPAVTMEEVAPVSVSDANLLAPEEVHRRPKHELLGKSERSRTDKNRERRKKKEKQRAIHKALEAKDVQRQKMGIPISKKEENAKLLKTLTKHRNVEKMNISNDSNALKSSKAFFSKLQDATNSVNNTSASAKAKAAKKKSEDIKTLSAKKLKL